MSALGSAPDPPRADALGPRFEVRGELGRGGMGIVYRAFDRQLGREVAVKLILNATGQRMQRLEREGQSLANLSHSGIVRVHEGGEHGGQPFLVCELVEGARTLDRVLPELSLRARLERVRDAAAALGAAHTVGVVHRDVKPENLLIDAGGRLFVTDFGLALVAGASRLTHTGALLGTPHYMSPEQVLGQRESQGPPSDVWSLGVVLYLALTDALPFEGENLGTLGYSIANDPAPAPSSRAPGLDRALDAICARALEKDPAQRYPHGGALAADLDAYLAGEGHAAGGGLRLAALSACGLLGLLGALGAWLAWGVEPAPAPSAPPRKPAPVQADRPPEADPYAGWFALDDDLPRYVLGGRLLREHPVHPRAAAVRDALAKLRRRPQPLALLEQDPETGYSTWVALRGGSLVGVDVRGVVAVWDLESGRETSRTPVGGGIDGAVVLGPDALLLSVQGPRAGLYAWSRGRELQSLIGRKVNDTSLVADATHFAAGTFDGKLHVFDRATHARVLRLEGLRYASEALALSPDGRALAAGAHSPGSRSKTELTEAELGVWDLAARSQTARVRIATQPRELRYSADSGALYVGSTLGTLECRDARTLALRFEFVVESADEFLRPRAHVGSMRGLEVLPDGRLLSLSRAPGKDIEPEVHQLHVWDPRDGRFLGAVAGLVHPPVSLAVDPERELIAVGTSTGHVVLLPLPRAE